MLYKRWKAIAVATERYNCLNRANRVRELPDSEAIDLDFRKRFTGGVCKPPCGALVKS